MNEPANASSTVSLVIPGRNCAATLDRCLSSVVPLKESGQLSEIIFVNDGSTDATAEIASRYPVRVLTGTGQGPGAARNLGWQAAETELIWFIDSDCVAEPDALEKLLAHMNDPQVAGVGGSYSNLYPDSLIATLIHEEIIARHRRMPREVDFLGAFNVIYRKNALASVAGFDECDTNGPRSPGAEDCDLSFRIDQSQCKLHFERDSVVGHHHPRSLRRYLRSQRIHGHWRVRLYRRHVGQMNGDSYTGMLDHLQPLVGLMLVVALPLTLVFPTVFITAVLICIAINIACGAIIACRLGLFIDGAQAETSKFSMPLLRSTFCLMSVVRSVARAFGIVTGLLSCMTRPPSPPIQSQSVPKVNMATHPMQEISR